MKRLAFIFVTLLFGSSPAYANAIDWATGAWGVDVENIPEDLDAEALDTLRGCKSSPVLINIDKETMRYKSVHTGENNFEGNAPILDSHPNWITLQYDDETRTMKNGELQIWHMYFVSQDKFYWVLGPTIYANNRDGVMSVARVRCQTLTS